MSVGPSRAVALRVVESLLSDDAGQIIAATRDLVDQGLELFKNRADKDWGATDCISFVAMRRHRLTDAATADRHFEQAGFRALML